MASPKRKGALINYAVILCLAFLFGWHIMRVHRAPLPREEIAALTELLASAVFNDSADDGSRAAKLPWPKARLFVSALPGALDAEGSLAAFVEQLGKALNGHGVPSSSVQVELATADAQQPPANLPGCTLEGGGASACLESLERAAVNDSVLGDTFPSAPLLSSTFRLLIAPAADCSSLLLDTKTNAVLRWRRGFAPLAEQAQLAEATAKRLKGTWFRHSQFGKEAPLLETAPSYVFSFFLVSDCESRVAWDFSGSVLEPYLRGFLDRLHVLFDFELDSQVVQCGSLAGSGGSGTASAPAIVDEAMLRNDFLSRAGEWPGDTVTRGTLWMPPHARFVAFRPTRPLRVVDAQERTQRSFAVQGWGAVAITDATDETQGIVKESCGDGIANFLSDGEAQHVASSWVSHLRSWLALPPDAPIVQGSSDVCSSSSSGQASFEEGEEGAGLALAAARPHRNGIADWELLAVAEAVHGIFLRRTAETLENIRALVDGLPDLVVSADIGEMVEEAAKAATQAVSMASSASGSAVTTGTAPDAEAEVLAQALRSARRALSLALTASHDDTVVAQTFFSTEFKYAVYLPLFLPIFMPIMASIIREFRRSRDLRKKENEGEKRPRRAWEADLARTQTPSPSTSRSTAAAKAPAAGIIGETSRAASSTSTGSASVSSKLAAVPSNRQSWLPRWITCCCRKRHLQASAPTIVKLGVVAIQPNQPKATPATRKPGGPVAQPTLQKALAVSSKPAVVDSQKASPASPRLEGDAKASPPASKASPASPRPEGVASPHKSLEAPPATPKKAAGSLALPLSPIDEGKNFLSQGRRALSPCGGRRKHEGPEASPKAHGSLSPLVAQDMRSFSQRPNQGVLDVGDLEKRVDAHNGVIEDLLQERVRLKLSGAQTPRMS